MPKDLGKAAELYQKAADQGNADGQDSLGSLYEHRQGVIKDLGKAVELYQKAADQGHAGAQFNLGWLYEHGQGVPQDFSKAAELYQKAADQGYARAQTSLGWLYENGQGVPKDLGKARELYQKAANQDSRPKEAIRTPKMIERTSTQIFLDHARNVMRCHKKRTHHSLKSPVCSCFSITLPASP